MEPDTPTTYQDLLDVVGVDGEVLGTIADFGDHWFRVVIRIDRGDGIDGTVAIDSGERHVTFDDARAELLVGPIRRGRGARSLLIAIAEAHRAARAAGSTPDVSPLGPARCRNPGEWLTARGRRRGLLPGGTEGARGGHCGHVWHV